ncbi:hypothetical protein CONCODRAFT_11892, partial [Conidiobolus coronatus NRRL 28638]
NQRSIYTTTIYTDMEVVLAAHNNQELTNLLAVPFTEAIGRSARDYLLQSLPQFLGLFLHKLFYNVRRNSKKVTFQQLYQTTIKTLNNLTI